MRRAIPARLSHPFLAEFERVQPAASESRGPVLDVAIAIIIRAGKVLICQRPATTTFPGCWEFPGGKREPGESLERCLAREIREELSLNVSIVAGLEPLEHDYPTRRIRLHPFLCTDDSGAEPQPLACDAMRWVAPQELRAYAFPPANEALIERVIDRLGAESAQV